MTLCGLETKDKDACRQIIKITYFGEPCLDRIGSVGEGFRVDDEAGALGYQFPNRCAVAQGCRSEGYKCRFGSQETRDLACAAIRHCRCVPAKNDDLAW